MSFGLYMAPDLGMLLGGVDVIQINTMDSHYGFNKTSIVVIIATAINLIAVITGLILQIYLFATWREEYQ